VLWSSEAEDFKAFCERTVLVRETASVALTATEKRLFYSATPLDPLRLRLEANLHQYASRRRYPTIYEPFWATNHEHSAHTYFLVAFLDVLVAGTSGGCCSSESIRMVGRYPTGGMGLLLLFTFQSAKPQQRAC
jgi:hypothetical protein